MGATTEAAADRAKRDGAIDLLRGVVMVLMALDHVRDFTSNVAFEPTDLTKTNGPLFFTRWITHFCAPVFVALAGAGAHLQEVRGKSKVELSKFLLTRGLWLVLLELTVVRFGWAYNVDYQMAFGQVIWALGWSMIVLAGLVHAPRRLVLWGSLGAIVLHDLADGVRAKTLGGWAPVWALAHEQGPIMLPGKRMFFVAYPLVPWIFVMAAAWASWDWLAAGDAPARRRRLVRVGAAMIGLFIALRLIGVYGDPTPFTPQATPAKTLMALVNCNKYPPSLSYLLMTLGPSALALAALDMARGPVARAIEIFGRVPLFYYLLHLLVIHAVAIGLASVRYGAVPDGMFAPPFGWRVPAGYGYSLPVVYAVWVGVVVGLYPACHWFAALKARNKSRWLSYL